MASSKGLVEKKNTFRVYKTVSSGQKNIFHVYRIISAEKLFAFVAIGKS